MGCVTLSVAVVTPLQCSFSIIHPVNEKEKIKVPTTMQFICLWLKVIWRLASFESCLIKIRFLVVTWQYSIFHAMLSCDFFMIILLVLFCVNLIVMCAMIFLYFVPFNIHGFSLKSMKICLISKTWDWLASCLGLQPTSWPVRSTWGISKVSYNCANLQVNQPMSDLQVALPANVLVVSFPLYSYTIYTPHFPQNCKVIII